VKKISATKILRMMFGVESHINKNPLTGLIATTVTKWLDSNFDRVGFVIINLSANDVFVAPDPTVASDHGIFLSANGGYHSATILEDFAYVNEEFYAIAVGAVADVFIIEIEAESVV